MEFMLDNNGQPQFLCIDKGGQKVNVGSKLSDFTIIRKLTTFKKLIFTF